MVAAQLAASPSEMWQRMAGRHVQECGTRMAPSARVVGGCVGAGLVCGAAALGGRDGA